MGSKHSPPRWWLLGGYEEALAEERRQSDAKWEEEARRIDEMMKAVFPERFDLKPERRYIPPSTKTVDEFSMGCRVASSPCRICQKDECSHMYQQDPPPLTEQQKIDQDVELLGTGFGMLQDDGTIKHLPATKILVYSRDTIHARAQVRLPIPITTIKLKLEV